MNMNAYAGYTKNETIRAQSSSGGIFYELATSVLNEDGIVFGAAWDSDWLVDIISIKDVEELPKIMKSKYVLASTKNTFEETKGYLEAGKKVLYSALPCQIYALKRYLKRDYDNLICVDICCHGTMSVQIWKDYLKSIKKSVPIVEINMRDKSNGWRNWNVYIKWQDGSFIKEYNRSNPYISKFLSDRFLRSCCYDCKFKNEYSISDLMIGDYWSSKIEHAQYDDDKGFSAIVTYTEKGEKILHSLKNVFLISANLDILKKHNGGMNNKINKQPETKSSEGVLTGKRIGIITLPLHGNMGGVIQNYALQKALCDLGADCTTIETINTRQPRKKQIPFTASHIKITTYDTEKDIKENDFDAFVVGSDQVWRTNWFSAELSFLHFAQGWRVKKVGYAISVGKDRLSIPDELRDNIVKPMLKEFNALSFREFALKDDMEKTYGVKNAPLLCDPAMLLTKEDYKEVCKGIPSVKGKVGIYFLDNHPDAQILYKKLVINPKNLYVPTTVEQFFAMYRDCDLILTDSFHGTVFSLIFNRRFICLRNEWRGNARFDTLIKKFNIGEHFYNSINDINPVHITAPNVDLKGVVQEGKQFLINALK